jgi:hypothetical protein
MRTQAIRVASSRMRKAWVDLGPGSPFGEKFYVNPRLDQIVQKATAIGWHATNLHHRDQQTEVTIQEQIENGKFHKIGKDLYFAPNNPEIAVHFGAVGREIEEGTFEPVLLNIGSKKIIPQKNETFGTYYFPGTEEGDVHILEAYKVNRAYLDYVTNPELRPTYSQKLQAALQAGWIAYSKELEKI